MKRSGPAAIVPPLPRELLRLPDVLVMYPVSRATWWRGVRAGIYPAAVKLSPRVSVWRASDIRALIHDITGARQEAS